MLDAALPRMLPMLLRSVPHGLAAVLISMAGFYLYKTHVLFQARNLFWDLYVYLAGEILRARDPAIDAWTTRNLEAMATLTMVILMAATTHSWLLGWNPGLVVPVVVLATVGLWSVGCAERRTA